MRRIAATLTVFGALLFSAGSAWADWDDGVAAYERGDYATARKEIRPLADRGHADAQHALGVMYDLGNGVPEKPRQGIYVVIACRSAGQSGCLCESEVY